MLILKIRRSVSAQEFYFHSGCGKLEITLIPFLQEKRSLKYFLVKKDRKQALVRVWQNNGSEILNDIPEDKKKLASLPHTGCKKRMVASDQSSVGVGCFIYLFVIILVSSFVHISIFFISYSYSIIFSFLLINFFLFSFSSVISSFFPLLLFYVYLLCALYFPFQNFFLISSLLFSFLPPLNCVFTLLS